MSDETPAGARRAAEALVEPYGAALDAHGDSPGGFLWPSEADQTVHYEVMLDVIEPAAPRPVVLADLACGSGGLLTFIEQSGMEGVTYKGFDSSHEALSLARRSHPGVAFAEFDVGSRFPRWEQLECDYLIVNGLFTTKFSAAYDDMWELLEWTVRQAWPFVRRGLAFNVMSDIVDWRRYELFHVPLDDLARLLHGIAGRGIRFRADYGLYTYTAYAYKGREWRTRPGPSG